MTDIYTYLDYREFLKEKFKEKKKANRYFTRSYFSKMAGLKSPYYISLIMNGKRNLSHKTIQRFGKALDLSKNEQAYFENLVLFNQCETDAEKEFYFDRLLKLRPKEYVREVDPDQFEYFTKRYYVTIREMVALKDFREDYDWIANRVKPKIKRTEAKRAVEVLLRLGLLRRNEMGCLEHTKTVLTSFPKMDSVEVYDYTKKILTEAKQAILNDPIEWIDMISMTVPVSKEVLPNIQKILHKCKEEILTEIKNHAENFEEVMQFNLQFYPVTLKDEDEG